jgi:hypothetical protein
MTAPLPALGRLQDCRLRIGLDLKTRSGYLEIRENHASLKIHSGGWSVLYDL